jgi:hypothetical protein
MITPLLKNPSPIPEVEDPETQFEKFKTMIKKQLAKKKVNKNPLSLSSINPLKNPSMTLEKGN